MGNSEPHDFKSEAAARRVAAAGRSGTRADVFSTLRDRTPVEQPKPLLEGQAVWGKESTFTYGVNAKNFAAGPTRSVTWTENPDPEDPDDPNDDEDPDNKEPQVDEWQEVARTETLVRIEGPDGPGGAYVDFKRIDQVVFKAPNLPDGREYYIVLNFKTSDPGVKDPGKGSDGTHATGAIPATGDNFDSGGGPIIRDPLDTGLPPSTI